MPLLRSYHSSTPFCFSLSGSLKPADARVLNKIEIGINDMITKTRANYPNNINAYIDITNLDMIITGRISLVVKNVLNQYDIGHFERSKWCRLRKYTCIKLDKLIPRVINNSDRVPSFAIPIEQIVSNAIDILKPSTKSSPCTPKRNSNGDAYKHDYLNSVNKGEYRRARR